MVSEVFWVGLYSSLIGFTLAAINMCYRSKCEEVGVCCIKIRRNIEAEKDEDLEAMRMKNGAGGEMKV